MSLASGWVVDCFRVGGLKLHPWDAKGLSTCIRSDVSCFKLNNGLGHAKSGTEYAL